MITGTTCEAGPALVPDQSKSRGIQVQSRPFHDVSCQNAILLHQSCHHVLRFGLVALIPLFSSCFSVITLSSDTVGVGSESDTDSPETEDDDGDEDEEEEVPGVAGSYYGGYGRCYNCSELD